MKTEYACCVYLGDELARYAFGNNHPFGPLRHSAFSNALYQKNLDQHVDILRPVAATQEILELFHEHEYIEKVKDLSESGGGYLDQGDTPAFSGMYDAALTVAGTVCDAIDRLVDNEYTKAFVPIAGLHHARRHTAAGFCVINDCGIAIEYLRHKHHINRIAYIDIDAHHGDGVFYSFENDPDLIFVDFHEDGRFLYPGTGNITETGKGGAKGTKLNFPMPPGAGNELFMQAWPRAEEFIRTGKPEFVLIQCGADSICGDPITHMAYTECVHKHVVTSVCRIANEFCGGRVVALGGGGYNLDNIAKTWTTVVSAMIEVDRI
ncbi:acetoin utilization protein AcuC [Nitrosomonas sp. Nm51]|uniref:acetoin utilization protein AcuC n=1 Tax=Nitrosomonas sp. Nm51 TaxID=133720 RepID=UPI0008B331F8|nr:acetoin utilization protein AcuC [Nitrosomonas sp. Nm51]SER26701.1 acetoin utilization protein AcuC [Nitrosomonas sp. Nm51]